MANRFFNNLIDILPLSKARSAQVESNFSAVGAGFDVAQEEVDLEVATRIEMDDLEIATRIENDDLEIAARIANDDLEIAARIANDDLEIAARIANDDLEIAARIENDDLEIAARIANDALKVNLSGGTYTGTHNLSSALLLVKDPQTPDQASNRRYVDSLLLAAVNAAQAWSASTNYTLGKVVYSPISFQSYRRRVAGTSALDPSLDADNWAALTGGAAYGPINFIASSY
jgi:hypothetical protein